MLLLETIGDAAKLMLAVAGLYLAGLLYARQWQPGWIDTLRARRTHILWLLLFTSIAIKIVEDVVTGDSGAIDQAILLFIHAHSQAAQPVFRAVTLSGSADVLVPLTAMACVALGVCRRWREARLVGLSVLCAAALVGVTKLVIGRDRPAMWDTEWYWGASFPSGHTLVVAAFAMSLAQALSAVKPAWHRPLLAMAALWTALVAFSRLVLGVHWPTDVMVAALAGAAIPLGISLRMVRRA